MPLTLGRLIGIGDNGPAGGSATQYFVGEFDGTKFVNDNPSNQTLWVDYGSDFYAAQTWSNLHQTDGIRVAVAWMDNWKYAHQLPTSPWRGQTTLPRTLGLMKTEDGIRLTQTPIKELAIVRGEHLQLRNATWQDVEALLSGREWTETLEIEAVLDCKGAQEFGLLLRGGESYGTRVGFDPIWSRVYIDRSHSGDVIIDPTFAAKHESPIRVEDGRIEMHIFVDRSSVELFANNGLVSITYLFYPRERDRSFAVYATGKPPSVISFDVWALKGRAAQDKVNVPVH